MAEQRNKKIHFTALLVTLLLFMFMHEKGAFLWAAEAETNDEIRIGIFSFNPVNFIAKDGTAQGINPDLLREIFREEKAHLSFVPLTWAEGLEKLQAEEIDTLMSVEFSLELAELLDFSKEPVMQLWAQVFVRPDHPLNNIRDLFDKNVGIVSRDISGLNFINLVSKLGGSCRVKEYKTYPDVFSAIQSGEVEAGIAPQQFGLHNLQDFDLVGTSILFSPYSIYFATKKGLNHQILNQIDNTLSIWKKTKNSFYYQTLEKWLAPFSSAPSLPTWLWPGFATVATLAFVSIIFVIMLNASVKRKTRALRHSERRFRDILLSISDWFWEIDQNGNFTFSSEQSDALLGYKPEELSGKPITSLLDPGQPATDTAQFTRLFTAGSSFRNQEQMFRHKDGATVYLSISGITIVKGNGEFIGFRGIATDITRSIRSEIERKALEERLAQSQKMEAVGTLAGGIAHDFNNILAAILGYGELAQEECSPDTALAGYLREIIKSGSRAKDLVNQILAFSRRAEVTSIPLRPAHVVKEAIRMLRPSLPTTIEIRQYIDDTGDYIFANPAQLSQVVLNLSTNAFHAMENNGGILEIRLQKIEISEEDLKLEPELTPGLFFRLSIADSGHGIPPEIRDKIFDPYFTTKEQGKGIGMGLSIVHGAVRDFKGYISCQSSVGKGTVFHVYMPIFLRDTDEAQEETPPIKGGSEKILCVDDERMIVDMQEVLLRNLGYAVQVTTESTEALEMVRAAPDEFDLVITDQTMPKMTGVELAEELLKIRPDLPIILCTGFSSIVTEEKVKSMGVKELVYKPLAKKELALLIRKVLNNEITEVDAENEE